MAKFNEILVGRLNRGLQKLLSMKGGPPAPQLSSEIQTTLGLELGVEFRYLEGWNRYGVAANVAAVIAQNTAFRVRNPTGSNVIGVVEYIGVTNPGGADTYVLTLGTQSADLGTIQSAIRLDARQGTTAGVLVASAGNNVAIAQQFDRFSLAQNVLFQHIVNRNQQIAILPGDAFQVMDTSTNQALNFGCRWRERFLEDSERT